MAVSLKEIAKDAGVSVMTVSRVLRGTGRVSPATRIRVRSTAARLNYPGFDAVAFPHATRKISQDHCLRLLLPTFGRDRQIVVTNRFTGGTVEGMRSRLQQMGGELIIEHFDSPKDILTQNFRPQIHGLAVLEQVPLSQLSLLAQTYPVVCSTANLDVYIGVDCVYSNEYRSAVRVLEQLRQLGHRRIAWFGIVDTHTPQAMYLKTLGDYSDMDGFLGELHGGRHAAWAYMVHGRVEHCDDMRLLIRERDWRSQSLEDVVSQTVDEMLTQRRRPTAVVVTSAIMGAALIAELAKRGLRVPQDISIVGYGMASDAEASRPPLTVVAMPMVQTGRMIPELIQRRIADPHAIPLSIQVDSEWHAGASTAPPPKDD